MAYQSRGEGMEYDVMMVAAGSGECIRASRLSSDPTRAMLVWEADSDDIVSPTFSRTIRHGRTLSVTCSYPSCRAQRSMDRE